MYQFTDRHRLHQGIGIGEAQILRPEDSGLDFSEPAKLAYQERLRQENLARQDQAARAKAEAKRINSLSTPEEIDTKNIPTAVRPIIEKRLKTMYDDMVKDYQEAAANPNISKAELENMYRDRKAKLAGFVLDMQNLNGRINGAVKNPGQFDEDSRKMLDSLVDAETYKKIIADGGDLEDISLYMEDTLSGLTEQEKRLDVSKFLKGKAYPTDRQSASELDTGGVKTVKTTRFDAKKAMSDAENIWGSMTPEEQLEIMQREGLAGGKDDYVDFYIDRSRNATKTAYLENLKGTGKSGSKGQGSGVIVEEGIINFPSDDIPGVIDPSTITRPRMDEIDIELRDPSKSVDEINALLEEQKTLAESGTGAVAYRFSKPEGKDNPFADFEIGDGENKIHAKPQRILYNATTQQSILELTGEKDKRTGKIPTFYVPVNETFNTSKLKNEYPSQMKEIRGMIDEIEGGKLYLKGQDDKPKSVNPKYFNSQ